MLGSLLPERPVSIYGAGFSGLTVAYRMQQLGLDFHLYEKQRIGGKISSHSTVWGPLERAASTFYMNAEAERFIRELQLPYVRATSKLKRWIWLPDGATTVPTAGMLSALFLRAFKRFPSVTEDSTVEDIFLPLFGRKYTDELLSSSLQGIYTAEARALHFLSLFPWAKDRIFTNYFQFLYAFKKELGTKAASEIKGSISFPGGMQTLIGRLQGLMAPNIHPAPEEFQLKANTVICTSAPDAAILLEDAAPDVAEILGEIDYQPITSYGFFLKHELTQLKASFGLLIPQKFNSPILGIIHQSDIFPENYQAPCYTVICKGVLSQEEVLSELERKVRGFHRDEVLESSLESWRHGLPFYNRKRYQAIQQLQKVLPDHPGLMLFGNYTDGISLRAIIEQSRGLKI